MAWIELHQSLIRHPKTLRVADTLGVSRLTVVGHLAALWGWAIDAKPDGGPLTDLDVRAGAEWDARKDFTAALAAATFLDVRDDGFWIHDWDEYAGRLIRQRKLARDRARKARESSANSTHTVRAQFAPTVPNPTVPYPTDPDPTDQDDHSLSRAKPQPVSGLPELTEPQNAMRVLLHRMLADRMGIHISDAYAGHDLVRRGLTETDIEAAIRACEGRRVSWKYVEAILRRRVEEREAGNDPDAGGSERGAVRSGGAGAGPRGQRRGSNGYGGGGGFTPPVPSRPSDLPVYPERVGTID